MTDYTTGKDDEASAPKPANNVFLQDVLEGLSASPRHLDAKYFYDKKGDLLFQKIMGAPEYYLTGCEAEILSRQAPEIIAACCNRQSTPPRHVVELGAGDASKSVFLLKELARQTNGIHYYPVDISGNVIRRLSRDLPEKIKGITVQGLQGDYFKMLSELSVPLSDPKLVLFLGSTIGNMPPREMQFFLQKIQQQLRPSDYLLTGFDLVKDPRIILPAYDDAAGYTRAFNLNLLERINKELDGDFNPRLFRHSPIYDPDTHNCESYLISEQEQWVHIAGRRFHFDKGTPIFMELSHKFTTSEVADLAIKTGFRQRHCFFDQRQWFLDALWEK